MRSRPDRRFAAVALALGGVVVLAFADGGFFPGAWGWATLALAAAAGLGLLLGGRVGLSRSELLVAGALAALAGWTALSALWSPDPGVSLLEARRTLVYVAGAVAAFVVATRSSARGLVVGAVAGTALVCTYAVVHRLVTGAPDPPDPFEGTLLQEPLGYANALGALAAIGLAAAAGRARLRAVPLILLLATALALTASRGAWIAAATGSLAALALALGRRRIAGAVVVVAAVALAVALILPSGPLADDLAERAGDRPWYWQVAWREAAAAPIAGRGAGTFALAWLERQPVPVSVQDAHSLYLETLAELGVVGLALVGAALFPPLVPALRGASPAAAGGYLAFLVHAGIDWDWEMPAVTLAGLFCGAALLVSARGSTPQDRASGSVSRDDPREGVSR